MLEMGPLLWAYPLIKRVSWWPQAWLGLAVNIGFSLAWFQVDAAMAPKLGQCEIVDLSLARAMEELRESIARSPQMPAVNLLMVLGTSWYVLFLVYIVRLGYNALPAGRWCTTPSMAAKTAPRTPP